MKKVTRKTFIHTTTFALAGTLIGSRVTSTPNIPKIKAVAFDAFAIFDPRPIFKTVEELFPNNGKQLIQSWQYKQFSYQWLRLLGNKYKNFWDVTREALAATLLQFGMNHTEKEQDLIMAKYDAMSAWPDVTPALQKIKKETIKLCFLSNMTAEMLHRGIENAALKEYFDLVISTDERQTYKPSTEAYQMGVETLKLRKEEILYVPFAGWDMAGAKWFGHPTFWLNRMKASAENLGVQEDGQGTTLNEVFEFVRTKNKNG